MRNAFIAKVIAINGSLVTVLPEDGVVQELDKKLFDFHVSKGDDVMLYKDASGTVIYAEKASPALGVADVPAPAQHIVVTHESGQGYDEGSFWLGFLLTFFFPLVGLVVALVFNKPKTRRGAVKALMLQIILFVCLVLLVMCLAIASS